MSNDLVELTNTELDAVSGGKTNALAMNFGNAVTQVNQAQNSGAAMGSGNVTQNLTNTGNNSISNSPFTSTNSGTFSFGNFNFSI
jgi:hypothetical protein